MLFNLSLKNIKKSIKDYSIYFFTLVVAVAIFYIFNSLDSQSSMLVLNESKYRVIENLVTLLGYVSVFVSIILGFLIIYSNNFLIKRRKKEMGLYLTLGMSKRKVSMILVIETFIVGVFSLGIGLVVGIVLSQFLSIVTAKLFEVNMTSFKFIFSEPSLIKTLIYFGIIFVLVMIFNIISLSRYKLIDLLTASKKNEKIKFKNKWVTIISFILSIVLISYAYKLLFSGVLLNMYDKDLLKMIIFGAIATFLFFFSLSGFLLTIFQKTKIYYKGLNMFVLKQVNSKVNTSVFSTTIICLMLLLTIGILSGSMSLSSAFNKDFEKSNITDFTIFESSINCIVEDDGSCTNELVSSNLKDEIINKKAFNKYVKEYAYYDIYGSSEITMRDLLDKKSYDDLIKEYGNSVNTAAKIDIISETDYNKIMNLYGKKDKNIDLSSNEYILTTDIESVTNYYKGFYESGSLITLLGNSLKPATSSIVDATYKNFSTASNYGTIIVDDSLINGLDHNNSVLIGNYVDSKDVEKLEAEFLNSIDKDQFHYNYITKLQMRDNGVALKVILTFVGLYLGIIFAISSVTVLAIGQLSDSSDNKERYKVLKQIGADEKMINKALFSQISIAFLLPLVVALFHSFFALKELNRMIKIMASLDLTTNIFLTSLFIIIVYGGYFLATYLCSKTIIKE